MQAGTVFQRITLLQSVELSWNRKYNSPNKEIRTVKCIQICFFASLCTMLNKLQQKWNVSSQKLFMILCTFAITGTSTAYVSRSITAWVGFNETTFWLWAFLLRLSILIFGYQFILLIVAFVLGQFKFFWNYEKKILRRMGVLPYEQIKLAFRVNYLK